MNETKTLEQQVAELTEEQKDTILKVDKYGTIIVLALTLPGLLLLCLGLFCMIMEVALFTETAYKGFQVLGGIVLAISIAAIIFIKVKFPYYSDKKASYIRKIRKSK